MTHSLSIIYETKLLELFLNFLQKSKSCTIEIKSVHYFHPEKLDFIGLFLLCRKNIAQPKIFHPHLHPSIFQEYLFVLFDP